MQTVKLAVTMNQLDFDKVPEIVGADALKLFEKLYHIMRHMPTKPMLFSGSAGTGKSIMGYNLLKKFALENNTPAYIVQASPELTKSTLVIGKQLKSGSLVTVKGCLAVAAEEGAPAFVDEAQQSSQELLATMQSLFERTANITDGSEIVYPKKNFRVIFASNPSTSHAGNVPLPQAFASRVIAVPFKYPSFEDDTAITYSIAQDPQVVDIPLKIPDPVIRFLVHLMREHRNDFYPLSARNTAACVGYMNVVLAYNGFAAKAAQNSRKPLEDVVRAELNLAAQQNLEVFLTKVYERIHNIQPPSTMKLVEDKGVKQFLSFLCAYGAEEFLEAIKANFMTELDMDASFHEIDAVKNAIRASILPS
jgi:DNA polymerase III delta prime subunit